MSRIYLETSFVSACVTTRTSLRSTYEREASLAWWISDSTQNQLFVYDEVLIELGHPSYPRRGEALQFIHKIPVIGITEEMITFADVLVQRMVMPNPIRGDAMHVATGCV